MPTNKEIASKLKDVSLEFYTLSDWLRGSRWSYLSNMFWQMAYGLNQLAEEIEKWEK